MRNWVYGCILQLNVTIFASSTNSYEWAETTEDLPEKNNKSLFFHYKQKADTLNKCEAIEKGEGDLNLKNSFVYK